MAATRGPRICHAEIETMGHSILLVDDDAELGSLMGEFFAQHGIDLTSEHDSGRGLAKALDGAFDLSSTS
jgi:CheY-like chemotaxis protein